MRTDIKPYKRQKGSPNQKRNLFSFNVFTDILVQIYSLPNDNNNIVLYDLENYKI